MCGHCQADWQKRRRWSCRLKERRIVRGDLDEFVECYRPENRHQRKPTWEAKKNPEGRWRGFTYDEIVARDKCSLDIFWLKDESLEDSSKLPDPHVLAAEIAEDLRSALEQIESVLGDLQDRSVVVGLREQTSPTT
jgi:type I restriction enzyme M protein